MQGSLLNQRVRLERVLREGRQGTSFLATDEVTGELLAVKLFARDQQPQSARFAFRAQLRRISDLRHPHLVLPSALGKSQGHWFLAAPYFPAAPLDAELSNAQLTADEVFVLLGQLAGGVSALHERGMVHGGIVPRRVLITRIDALHGALIQPLRHLLHGTEGIRGQDVWFAAPEQDPRLALPLDGRADL